MRKSIFVSFIVLATVLMPLGVLPGYAQEEVQESGKEGITVRPSLFESRVQPGQTVTHVINVTNKGDVATIYYPEIRDIASMDERGAPIWLDPDVEKSGAEMSQWTSFSHSSVFLQPGETIEVSVFISVPANAPNGGSFGMASFVKNPPGVEALGGNSGLGIGFTTGALIALAIGDDIIDDAALREFRPNPRIGGGPGVDFETSVENSGNSLIRPIGVIEVTNMFGKFTSSVSFNEAGAAILPDVNRTYTTNWTGDGFLFGRYTADIFISYGTKARHTLVGTTTFWVLPAKPLVFGLGGALVAFLIVLAWVRTYIRRKLREAGASTEGRGSRPSSFIAIFISALIIAALALAFAFLFLA